MEVLSSGVVRVRKNHVCYGCMHDFPKGSMLYQEHDSWNGQVLTTTLCQDCYDVSREWSTGDWEASVQGEMGYWKDDKWHRAWEE